MLRISVLNELAAMRLKFEGKLAHEWVEEAERAWTALMRMKGESGIVVDLLDVSFVDHSGRRLLAAMRHAGAELVGFGPMMSALIEEIKEAEVARAEVTNDPQELHDMKEELEQ